MFTRTETHRHSHSGVDGEWAERHRRPVHNPSISGNLVNHQSSAVEHRPQPLTLGSPRLIHAAPPGYALWEDVRTEIEPLRDWRPYFTQLITLYELGSPRAYSIVAECSLAASRYVEKTNKVLKEYPWYAEACERFAIMAGVRDWECAVDQGVRIARGIDGPWPQDWFEVRDFEIWLAMRKGQGEDGWEWHNRVRPVMRRWSGAW